MTRNEYTVEFWKRVKYYKNKKKTTWNLIAIHAGLTLSNIKMYKSRKKLPTAYKILAIAKFLDCSMEDLCDVTKKLD